MSKRDKILIREYDSFAAVKGLDGYVYLPQKTLDQLEKFILENRSGTTDALELMGLSARKGVGKIITARNYVGVITMNDGTTIEILPKIYSQKQEDETSTKRLLVEMLRTLREAPFKTLQTANVNIERMNIFDFFIRMFIDEVFVIVKHGLKCSYEAVQDNRAYFSGKLIFSKQLRYNYIHKERSYAENDDFNSNRPENRLIKATLLFLFNKCSSAKNKNDLTTLLNAFGNVTPAADYASELAKCAPDRNMGDYERVLMWCRVFLAGRSFTSFSGQEIANALLFPMENLFESYVAALLKKTLSGTEYEVSVQDKSHHLFDNPQKFQLMPDIVIKIRDCVYVLDTKWKVLSENEQNYGISQADMYQMYVYQKKYEAKNVTLLYPLAGKFQPGNRQFSSSDGVSVLVKFIDLFDIKKIWNSSQACVDWLCG